MQFENILDLKGTPHLDSALNTTCYSWLFYLESPISNIFFTEDQSGGQCYISIDDLVNFSTLNICLTQQQFFMPNWSVVSQVKKN